MILRPLACVTALALLAACGDEPAPSQQQQGGTGAEGEVEGGSISDAMLPIEAVTSQSPSRGGEDNGEGEEIGGDEGSSEDGDAPAS